MSRVFLWKLWLNMTLRERKEGETEEGEEGRKGRRGGKEGGKNRKNGRRDGRWEGAREVGGRGLWLADLGTGCGNG